MLLLLLLTGLLSIVLLEAPRMIAEQTWKELAVFLLLWSFSSAYAVAIFMGVELPNPTDLLAAIFAPK